MQPLESWGRYPPAGQAAVSVHWRSDPLPRVHGTLLPFGQGRSYGDCCLNDGGTLLETSRLDRFIEFDQGRGVLRCEAGVRIADILALTVPRGWFRPVQGPFIESETVPFRGLDELFALDADSSQRFEYTVAWIDPRPRGLRGLYFRGDHSARAGKAPRPKDPGSFPLDLPGFAISGPTVAAFNALYYARGRLRSGRKQVRYAPFFFPLDRVGRWNRVYGKHGLLQFQCVVQDPAAVPALLDRVGSPGAVSSLGV